jgi:hypothetical protein
MVPGPASRLVSLATLAIALTGVSCMGLIEEDSGSPARPRARPPTGSGGSDSGGSSGEGGAAGMTPPVNLPPMGSHPLEPVRDTSACRTIQVGPSPLRRLTRTEYDNTVRDLLGDDLELAQDFPPEELQDSFDNNATLRSVSDLLAEQYVAAAKAIGEAATDLLDTGDLLLCDPEKDGEPACVEEFLDDFALRAWRRPLTLAERDDLKKVFTAGRLETFADGIDAMVRVLVLSPQFMYRIETGVPVLGQSHRRLNHWEMASRLSYLLWGTMPDEALFEAADAEELGTREEVGAQAMRMLNDPRAAAMITNFAGQWLQLRELADADKDPTIYPAWDAEFLTWFRQETEQFVELVWKGDAKLDTLLSAPYTAVNESLAGFYGVRGITGDVFQKIDLDPTQRAGLLTQPGILAAKSGPDQSSPILRGVFVRQQLFCQPLPLPPPGVEAKPPELNRNQTTKERFAAHRMDPSCAACHDLIDNVGFGLENYDATGVYRVRENGKPVDATGELMGTDVDGKFVGAIELSRRLVSSKDVKACVAKHWFHFALGRDKTVADACTEETLNAAFARSGGDLRQLILTTIQSDAFFFKGEGQ